MIKIREDVKEFVRQVQHKAVGYAVYIGGGYMRDMYCGFEPKDVDLFFVPLDSSERVIPVIEKTYINFDIDSNTIPDMKKRGVKSVRGMFVPSLSTKNVQFIIYENFISAEDLAADMDMNINQIMYDVAADQLTYTDAFYLGHKNKLIQCLHSFDKERMFKRYERMELKFTDYASIGKPVFSDNNVVNMLSEQVRLTRNSGSYIHE